MVARKRSDEDAFLRVSSVKSVGVAIQNYVWRGRHAARLGGEIQARPELHVNQCASGGIFIFSGSNLSQDETPP
ncbi:MAG: hypothetical protein ABJB74_09805 [Gemmatimonas sp.]